MIYPPSVNRRRRRIMRSIAAPAKTTTDLFCRWFIYTFSAIGIDGFSEFGEPLLLIYYPHVPIGMLGIYRLLFVFVCPVVLSVNL